VGKKEVETASVSLRSRVDESQKTITISELSDLVTKSMEGKPKISSHLPRLLSTRPRFA